MRHITGKKNGEQLGSRCSRRNGNVEQLFHVGGEEELHAPRIERSHVNVQADKRPLPGRVLPLPEAARPVPRHLHVQRRHGVLQRGLSEGADRGRRGQGG